MLKVEDRYRQLKECEKQSKEGGGNNSLYGSHSASSKVRSQSKKTSGSTANLDTSTGGESEHGREY